MLIYEKKRVVRTFNAAVGQNPVGHKQQQGDKRTPEGRYFVIYKNSQSSAYKSLKISYPNRADRIAAQKRGQDPGGDICIHGFLNGHDFGPDHYLANWTWGCVAVTNAEMDEIFAKTRLRTPVIIYP
ncbi:MAG: L,D-transpeptidase family protein [Bernardetiaceae bacterium]|jgi:murein L,D-transpeptidase YafK|nr:L,D-transpeptidase family protein [Bernardetiaceae bacterium]